ncbi:MAG: hypothetical protein RL536_526 [Candidatus Parcubacteria bacterium]
MAVIVVVLLIYFYFSGGSSTNTQSGLTQIENANSAQVGMRVLNLLQQIRSLKIDTSLFKDQAYTTLLDYTVTIPEIPVGRPNPFAPLPGEVSRSASASR